MTTAETPWKTPAVGDNPQSADGQWYRHLLGFTTSEHGHPLLDTPPSGGYYVTYTDQYGNRQSCWCTTWWTWCAGVKRNGGVYRRAGDPPR